MVAAARYVPISEGCRLVRLRKVIDGQHHHVSLQYLYQCAYRAAWIEDHRRLDNEALAQRGVGLELPIVSIRIGKAIESSTNTSMCLEK